MPTTTKVKSAKTANKLKKSKTKNINLDKLGKAEARILIAKDALKQMKFWKITAGKYCEFNTVVPTGESLQKILPKVQQNCEVCAKGALFLSFVRKFNNVSTNDLNRQTSYDYNDWNNFNAEKEYVSADSGFICRKLEKYFTRTQLDLIEFAFEGEDVCGDTWQKTEEYQDKVRAYSQQFPDDEERLKVILKNIVRNGGTFKPEANKKGEVF